MNYFIVISLIKIHCTFYIFIYSILFIFTYIKIPLNYRGVTVRSQPWTVLTCPRAQKGDFCRTLHVLMMNEQKQIQHYLGTSEENSCDSAGGDIEVVLQNRTWWMCCSHCFTSHNWLALPDCHATINDLNAVWWHANPDDSTKLLYRHRLLTVKPLDARPFSSEEGDSHEFDANFWPLLSDQGDRRERVTFLCALVITVW